MMLDDEIARRAARRRSVDEKLTIVAESYEAGNTVAGVARRHGIVPSQLSGWRSAARSGRLALSSSAPPHFAKVTVSPDLALPPSVSPDGIEIVVGSVLVRLPNTATPRRISDIALRLSGPS
jgi:transposase